MYTSMLLILLVLLATFLHVRENFKSYKVIQSIQDNQVNILHDGDILVKNLKADSIQTNLIESDEINVSRDVCINLLTSPLSIWYIISMPSISV